MKNKFVIVTISTKKQNVNGAVSYTHLDVYKRQMYTVDDNLMTVFVFESGIATIYSFTEEPKVINL